VSPNRF